MLFNHKTNNNRRRRCCFLGMERMGTRFSTVETVRATAHLNNMGRDEMNLAEFPLTTLADRAPRGCKTLVFEDGIRGRGETQHRVQRLTISASDKYGLPTAIDDEVVLGLVQVTKAAGFSDRRVRFSRYELIHLLGWRDEGRSYRRLEQSLKRWLGVTLYYENAWRDNAQKRWVDAHFHLLDELVLYRRTKPEAGVRTKAGHAALSSFTWNEVVFLSFQAGFLKQLDLSFYRGLKLAVAKRMYRFLDKRFHFSNELRFNLPVFACEHIGLSRRYDSAQLKRRLSPAIAELEHAGYLIPLAAGERFHRLRRGQWEVVFVRTAMARRQRRPLRRLSDLENRLVERGVRTASAAQLVREHAADLIEGKIAVFDALRQKQDRRISRNPAGYLVKSIRDDYSLPAGVAEKTDRRATCLALARNGPTNSAVSRRVATETSESQAQQRVREYLVHLSPAERSRLEQDALEGASGIVADGFRRAMASAHEGLAAHYRNVILQQHVLSLLQPPINQA